MFYDDIIIDLPIKNIRYFENAVNDTYDNENAALLSKRCKKNLKKCSRLLEIF